MRAYSSCRTGVCLVVRAYERETSQMRYGVVCGGPSGGEEGTAWIVVLGGTIEPQPEPAQERSVSGVTREKEYDDPKYRSGGSIGG